MKHLLFPATLLTLALAVAPAHSQYCLVSLPQAPDAYGPGFYYVNGYGLTYGPNYDLRPCYPPFQGMIFAPDSPQAKKAFGALQAKNSKGNGAGAQGAQTGQGQGGGMQGYAQGPGGPGSQGYRPPGQGYGPAGYGQGHPGQPGYDHPGHPGHGHPGVGNNLQPLPGLQPVPGMQQGLQPLQRLPGVQPVRPVPPMHQRNLPDLPRIAPMAPYNAQGQPSGPPQFMTHTFCRSPRDFFMLD